MRLSHQKERDLRIDFFRGLALIFIFIDHIPDNTWALGTLRNFGFADASEVFVLLAGYSAGLAYWSTTETGGFSAAFSRASRRAREIYIWHIGLFVVSALLLYSAARLFNNPSYVNNIAISELATNPVRTLASALALFYQPNMMNILPMYVVLMFWLPFVIVMLRRSVVLALGVSFAIWFIANQAGLNLPAHQRSEGWLFNPFAWQLLFTTGAAASVLARRLDGTHPRPELAFPAVAYVVFSFLVAAPWVAISWLPDERLLAREILGPMSKSDLSVWRFLHVLALAYVIAALVPKNAPWLKQSWAHMVELCGKRSLEIFALGTLLSFFGWIALTELGSNQMTMLVVNAAGIAIMGMTAWQMSRRTSSQARPHSGSQPVQALAS
ncbi:OpgC domain-containing protein [Hyphomicrobium sp.]|uniref:OpgC family protein n=1 Tax=Hyphomicrobium sp. TaxID=82 RepID=UPI002E380807|nr:OpgC domain-containing protein [Hyphomicrobium sp.]HEX2842382.1 OpgC domain-containing protein [Hyphomicrobium sp.]